MGDSGGATVGESGACTGGTGVGAGVGVGTIGVHAATEATNIRRKALRMNTGLAPLKITTNHKCAKENAVSVKRLNVR